MCHRYMGSRVGKPAGRATHQQFSIEGQVGEKGESQWLVLPLVLLVGEMGSAGKQDM